MVLRATLGNDAVHAKYAVAMFLVLVSSVVLAFTVYGLRQPQLDSQVRSIKSGLVAMSRKSWFDLPRNRLDRSLHADPDCRMILFRIIRSGIVNSL